MRNEHLNLDECLMLYLVPEGEQEAREHLDACPECRARFRRVQHDMRLQAAEFRRQLDERPEHFWSRQRRHILSQVRQVDQRKHPVASFFDLRLWAAVASIFIFSIALLQWAPEKPGVTGPGVNVTARDDSRDDQLLRDVNQAISDDHSDPLQPLDLLVHIPKNLEKGTSHDGPS